MFCMQENLNLVIETLQIVEKQHKKAWPKKCLPPWFFQVENIWQIKVF